VVDREAVVLGVSDLNALHSRQHDHQVQFCAFDILIECDDDALRKTNLERLLAPAGEHLREPVRARGNRA
jgi:hypothetical protein